MQIGRIGSIIMEYISTRDSNSCGISSSAAILRGLAPDGGLYMPCEIPTITLSEIKDLCALTYEERAQSILSKFLTDYDGELLLADCREAYSAARFPRSGRVGSTVAGATQLVPIGDGIYSLELWHGPTCAFKDMALQIMPRLLSRALAMSGEKKTAHILVATSGDTGKAALEGYRDVDGVKITVFYPSDGVSEMQKRQMTTQEGENVAVFAVHGNFDDAQNGVKAIFSDKAMAEKAAEAGYFFSSANSINWGRLAPQIVYYVSAYCDLLNSGAIKLGDEINVAVPTGNFGNIFAAYIARTMGTPIKHLICASNSNDVLTEFINTGRYNRVREFHKTISPSMDILISSNLERFLFALGGCELTRDCMKKLSECGEYTIDGELLVKLRGIMSGYSLNEDETMSVIRDAFRDRGYSIDTHTAVGLGAVMKYREETGDKLPTVLASTASPYKFAKDVCSALGVSPKTDDPEVVLEALSAATSTEIPAPLARTLTLKRRFDREFEPADMPKAVLSVM